MGKGKRNLLPHLRISVNVLLTIRHPSQNSDLAITYLEYRLEPRQTIGLQTTTVKRVVGR